VDENENKSGLEKYGDFTLNGLVGILEAECRSRDKMIARCKEAEAELEAQKEKYRRLKSEVAAIPHIEKMEGWDTSSPVWMNWMRAQARIRSLTAENKRLNGLVNEYHYNLEFSDLHRRELEKANHSYAEYNDALSRRIAENGH
jgi:uncharacterized protein YhaN